MGKHNKRVEVRGKYIIISVGKTEDERIVLPLALVEAVKQVYNANLKLQKKSPEVIVGTIEQALKSRRGLGEWNRDNISDALDYLAGDGQIQLPILTSAS